MVLLISFSFIFGIVFTTFVLANGTKDEHKQMVERFRALTRTASPIAATARVDLLTIKENDAQTWFRRVLESFHSAQSLEDLITQAGSTWTVGRIVSLCFASCMCTIVLVHIILPLGPLAIAAGALASALPIVYLRMRRKKRTTAFEKVLPEVIDTMSRSLRAGHSLNAAIGIVAENAPEPARTEFEDVFRKQNFGLPLRDALLELLKRIPSQDLRVLVTGILVQKETGGNITVILDRTAAVIRDRLKLQGDIRVHTAQGRITGWILCLMPIFLLIVLNVINPGYSKVLTETAIGHKLLYAGLALLTVGSFLIQRIVKAIEI